MSETPKRILVDTNVWLDYFIPSRRGRAVAIEFLRDACTAQVDLLYAVTSSKDLFYLISSEHGIGASMVRFPKMPLRQRHRLHGIVLACFRSLPRQCPVT